MFKKIISLFLVTALYLSPVFAEKTPRPVPNQTLSGNYRLTPPNPVIKILLARDLKAADINVEGPYRIFNPIEETVVSYGLFGKNYQVNATVDGIKWGEEFPGVFQVAIVPANSKTKIFVNNISYPGTIYIYQVNGKINLINQVKIEDYLKATLPQEVGSNMNEEAIAAAAIVARTDAYYQTLRYPKAYFHLEAKEIGYVGLNGIRDRSIDNSVDATRYLVLRQQDSNAYQGLFPAMWTAHSAGKTALASVIFRKPDMGPSVTVNSIAAQNDREATTWNLLIKKSDLAKAIGLKDVKTIALLKDTDSGKVFGVKAQGEMGTKEVDFIALQKALGKEKLQSSDFTLDVKGDIVCIDGHGKGHGVGLCLYSANKLAESGQDAVKVLQKYFPGAEVVMMPTLQAGDKAIY
jgi:stage II sporulation protein D